MTLIDWILSAGLFWAIYRTYRLEQYVVLLEDRVQRLSKVKFEDHGN